MSTDRKKYDEGAREGWLLRMQCEYPNLILSGPVVLDAHEVLAQFEEA